MMLMRTVRMIGMTGLWQWWPGVTNDYLLSPSPHCTGGHTARLQAGKDFLRLTFARVWRHITLAWHHKQLSLLTITWRGWEKMPYHVIKRLYVYVELSMNVILVNSVLDHVFWKNVVVEQSKYELVISELYNLQILERWKSSSNWLLQHQDQNFPSLLRQKIAIRFPPTDFLCFCFFA